MARRDAAALAGLAALGYAMLRKNRGEDVPVEDRTPSSASSATPDIAAMDVPTVPPMGSSADSATPDIASMNVPTVPPMGSSAPTRTASRPTSRPPTRATTPPSTIGVRSTGRGGPTAEEIAAYQNRVSGGARSTGQGGATADELAEYERRRRLMTPGADAVEGVYPEQYFLAPGLKTVASAAKALAGRAAPNVAARSTALGPRAVDELTFLGKSGRTNVTPRKQITATERRLLEGPKSGERVSAGARPKELPPASAARRLAEEEEMAALPMKKGGKAKSKKMASGGMSRSSASKRADGIAQRGKTKGRIF